MATLFPNPARRRIAWAALLAKFGSRPWRLLYPLMLVFLGAPGLAADVHDAGVTRYWSGALNYRGAGFPIRLELRSDGRGWQAYLDLPRIIMAWEPVETRVEERIVAVEFPFGLGRFDIDPDEEDIHVEKELGGSGVVLDLNAAPPPVFKREPFPFRSGDTDLAGELVLPDGPGPHPAFVLLHGSTRQGLTSWAYRSWADLLVREGFAVLYYDKRGVGDSGGQFPAGLRRLADDAVAAVNALRARSDIIAGAVGLKGGSQGAWVAQQAAADLGDVSSLILTSAAAVTPRQQELQKIEFGMRADGVPGQDIESALNYMGLYFQVARTGRGWPLLKDEIAIAQAASWGQYVDQPRSLDDLAWWKTNHDFQPADRVKELGMPVLLLYGGDDWVTPPVLNGERMKSLFMDPGMVELHVFPGADHRLELEMGTNAVGQWQWPQIAPGVFKAVREWLARFAMP